MSIYHPCLTFLFLVGAEGPAYLSKPKEFSLQRFLIEGGLLLPPGVKVVTSTVRSTVKIITCQLEFSKEEIVANSSMTCFISLCAVSFSAVIEVE